MLGRYVLAGVIALGLCCTGRAAGPTRPTKPLATVVELVWRQYDRYDPPPYITLVTGRDLNCSKNDAFLFPYLGCVYGVTLSPDMCVVAYAGQAWSRTSLAHELLHAAQFRHGMVDPGHLGPEWKSGGLLERANAELERNGL